MRLFLGVRAKLYDYEKIKKSYYPYFRGKWVEEENLHVTLYFFGEVEDKNKIIEKIKKISFPKKRVLLKGEGSFGQPPKILFVNLQKNIYLQSYLKLEEIFGKTKKGFKPHVTILRIKKILKKGYFDVINDSKKRELGYLKKEVILFQSRLTPNGPIYTPIYEF